MIHQDGDNGPGAAAPSGQHPPVRFISQTYDGSDSENSARQLILSLRPEWSSDDSNIELVRFTDGITNTLLKAINKRPGLSTDEVDREAILLRAYGHGTDLIIDRARETQNHELLSRHGLAPELLARFNNGMMYRFIKGSVTHPEDLRRPEIYLAVARRLAQWHATVPCLSGKTHISDKMDVHCVDRLDGAASKHATLQEAIDAAAPGKQAPNVWTVMQKWIFALPTKTAAQRERQKLLQVELSKLVAELSHRPGLGKDGLVFAHCDLLSGNVIVLPKGGNQTSGIINNGTANATGETVTFIDYEYAVPSPAAFDLCNHFAEWGGFDCDYNVLPTKSQRHEFITEYVRSYYSLLPEQPEHDEAFEIQKLADEVDLFRGVPGFYWGIWALIQATISEIDFDYASYAETRLGEYWAWKAEVDGSRTAEGKDLPLRERRWAEQ
ncbi:ethanolamine kinase [Diaporthe helianthi]|uniref:ethanolamine kinase n=1 Tax=Diaporthe helianthi TaxID=158607 RepID=A0A2P5HTN3_DIAHE|nr:ethanolamine kinase [Diaporthe helianthi]